MSSMPRNGRHFPTGATPTFNLDELMRQETLHETLQELVRQAWLPHSRFLDYLASRNPELCDTEAHTFTRWMTKGGMSRMYAEEIERAVNIAVGVNQPFLTRHYQK